MKPRNIALIAIALFALSAFASASYAGLTMQWGPGQVYFEIYRGNNYYYAQNPYYYYGNNYYYFPYDFRYYYNTQWNYYPSGWFYYNGYNNWYRDNAWVFYENYWYHPRYNYYYYPTYFDPKIVTVQQIDTPFCSDIDIATHIINVKEGQTSYDTFWIENKSNFVFDISSIVILENDSEIDVQPYQSDDFIPENGSAELTVRTQANPGIQSKISTAYVQIEGVFSSTGKSCSSSDTRESFTASIKGSESTQTISPANSEAVVSIENFSFSQAEITIQRGATITWANNDSTAHTATGDNGEFDTGTIQPGQSASVTFNQSGTFTYYCTLHPYMKAAVKVLDLQNQNSNPSNSLQTGNSSPSNYFNDFTTQTDSLNNYFNYYPSQSQTSQNINGFQQAQGQFSTQSNSLATSTPEQSSIVQKTSCSSISTFTKNFYLGSNDSRTQNFIVKNNSDKAFYVESIQAFDNSQDFVTNASSASKTSINGKGSIIVPVKIESFSKQGFENFQTQRLKSFENASEINSSAAFKVSGIFEDNSYCSADSIGSNDFAVIIIPTGTALFEQASASDSQVSIPETAPAPSAPQPATMPIVPNPQAIIGSEITPQIDGSYDLNITVINQNNYPISGSVGIDVPEGWSIEGNNQVSLNPGESKSILLKARPANFNTEDIKAIIEFKSTSGFGFSQPILLKANTPFYAAAFAILGANSFFIGILILFIIVALAAHYAIKKNSEKAVFAKTQWQNSAK